MKGEDEEYTKNTYKPRKNDANLISKQTDMYRQQFRDQLLNMKNTSVVTIVIQIKTTMK